MIATILLINLTIVILGDKLNIFESIYKSILSLLFKTNPDLIKVPKPFSCNMCMLFWITLIILVLTSYSTLSLPLLYVISLVNGYFIQVWSKIFDIIYNYIIKLLVLINRKLNS